VGLCPLRLLLDRLRRFSRLSEGEQFSTEVIALPFGLFAPALLFHHPLGDGYIKDTDEIPHTVT
jgi:hypothetical protein